MHDILGNYPQVYGSYYMMVADEQAIVASVWTEIDFTGETEEINVVHTPGNPDVTLSYGGRFLIEGSVKYDITGNGFASRIGIFIDGSMIASSQYEAFAESGITVNILRANTITGNLSAGAIVTLKIITFAAGGTTVREGEFESYLRIIRLR